MRGRFRLLLAALVLAVVLPAVPARAQPAGGMVPPVAGAPTRQGQPAGRFAPPVSGAPALPFSLSNNPFAPGSHRGVDYRLAEGTPVRAAGDGIVGFAGPVAGEGLFVTIDHPGGLQTSYSFLARINVVKGQAVSRGWVIGLSGQGHPASGAPGLHLGARQADRYIDPLSLFLDYSDISGMIRLVPQDRPYGAEQPQEPAGPDLRPAVVFAPAPRPAPAAPAPQQAPAARALLDNRPTPEPGPAGPGIPKSSDPKQVGRWWSGLGEVQQQELIKAQPKKIGGLNGVDSASRDKANRLALNREIARLRTRRTALRNRQKSATKVANARGYNWTPQLNQTRKDLKRVDRRLSNALNLTTQLKAVAEDKNDSLEPKDVYLLEYDTAFAGGDGKAVIALGDPYKADYVGVVVPGVNNQLANVDGVIEKAAALQNTVLRSAEANRLGPSASIAWLGYDTPQSLIDAMNREEAKMGARALNGFVTALRGGHMDAKAPLISVLGHSYGSTTAAMAVRKGMRVDNLILLGSPGAAASTGKKLSAADNLWAARTRDDPIRFATFFSWLGDDPTNSNFGSRKIPLDSTQKGHGGYFKRGSAGLGNMALIVTGQPDAVR